MLELTWKRCGDDRHYCSFERLNLATITDSGVYVIWYSGNPGRVVRIGQGRIAERVAAHRNDPEMMEYRGRGLNVTWAPVEAPYRDGVERYLASKWNPLIGDVFPDAAEIEVNSPFAAKADA